MKFLDIFLSLFFQTVTGVSVFSKIIAYFYSWLEKERLAGVFATYKVYTGHFISCFIVLKVSEFTLTQLVKLIKMLN